MDLKIFTIVISAVLAIVCACITIVGQFQLIRLKARLDREREKETKQEQAEAILARYRDPLAHAAFDLQSKLYNILKQNLLQVYLINGNESEREYTIKNTVYVVGQYLCWREVIRREVQYLDLGELEETRKLTALLEHIAVLFLTDGFGHIFRVFRGEQRAIGEMMIVQENSGLCCMGYAEFVNKKEESFRRWFCQLESDVEALSNTLPDMAARLIYLQHALIELLDYLDPKYVRFQEDYRRKV